MVKPTRPSGTHILMFWVPESPNSLAKWLQVIFQVGSRYKSLFGVSGHNSNICVWDGAATSVNTRFLTAQDGVKGMGKNRQWISDKRLGDSSSQAASF